MKRLNETESNSGGQDMPQTPTGSTSPVHQERIESQRNTDGDLHLTCRLDPDHPGEWRCTSVPGPVVPTTDSSVSTPSAETAVGRTGQVGSGIPTDDGIEVWRRSNGDAMRLKRVEHEGSVIFLPVATTPQPQPVNPQSPQEKPVTQEPAVGRFQASRCGRANNGSCKMPGIHPATRIQQNDQRKEGM